MCSIPTISGTISRQWTNNMLDITFLQTVLDHQNVVYALADTEGRITSHSATFLQWVEPETGIPPDIENLNGRFVCDIFVELAGLEEDIAQVAQNHSPAFKIEKSQRHQSTECNYITFTILPYKNEKIILLITDVTAEGKLEQRITQQRNELDLLSDQLVHTRNQLDDLLHRFLPNTVADQMVADPNAVHLGGERRIVTVMFADLRGFTSWTEGVEPEAALHMLNGKLAIAVESLLAYGGTVDKYMGDAVMGVFNTPLSDPDHAYHATQAAWQMIRAFKSDPLLQFSVGINTGTAVAGNIGTMEVMNYTVIGDAVNTAKRLQEMARPGQILISGETEALLPQAVELLPVGSFQLRGRKQYSEVFAITNINPT